MNSKNYSRQEIVPGIFFEYTYTNSWFTAIAGIREDHHNAYGFITTPRLHLKFDLDKKTNLRLSGGSGFRLADIFSENAGLFVSSRQYSILNRGSDYGYGLNPNKAWNYGANLVRQLNIRGHTGSLSLDLYHTYFIRQVVVDVDQSPQEILFYNLNGRSFASSIQLEWNQEIIKRLELRLAYRWMDVEQTYHGILMEKPLIARNRTLGNIAYETASHWKFDYTSQLIGKKRLPDTESNPAGKQFGDYSSPYVQMNVQVTRQFVRYWDVYTGVENLTGFTQKDRIIDPTEPFGKYFDASIVWGPVVGRMVYAGMRFKIK
jgi:outer membrane receptor for ferrienterochelin and colicin